MSNILSVKNLSVKKSNKEIINIEDFTITEGSITSIIGENGAGKTTFILTMAGLLKPSTGTIFFKNKMIKDMLLSEYRKNISIVFQENLLINDTVYNNIAMGLKFRKFHISSIEKKVDDILHRFKISHLKYQKANTLSGGEAKRVSIARALVIEPQILFLDEPFSSLDTLSKEDIITDMIKVLKDNKITVVMSTHDKYEAFRLSDSIIVLEKGKIIQKGLKEEIIKHPANSFVASFVGVENIIEGIIIEKKSGSFIAQVKNKYIEGIGDFDVGNKVLLCIRPENIFISRYLSESDTSARNIFRGKIIEILDYGHFYRVTIDCGFNLISYITKTSLINLSLKLNDIVFAGFKAMSVHTITMV
jgi:tungstate transport system ATP-binding protein